MRIWILILVLTGCGSVAAQSSSTTGSQSVMNRYLYSGLNGRWWRNVDRAQRLGLTAEQQTKMDDLFLQSRLKLIDLNAALEKEEAILEPMVATDKPDEAKIRGQIDRIAQARSELEKANAYLLLALRLVLSPEQWKKLKAEPKPSQTHFLKEQMTSSDRWFVFK